MLLDGVEWLLIYGWLRQAKLNSAYKAFRMKVANMPPPTQPMEAQMARL